MSSGDPHANQNSRQMPNSERAERAVIGAALLRPKEFEVLAAELEVDDFFFPHHREIWDAMREVARRGRPPEILMVADELKARGMLSRLEGGETYLLASADDVGALGSPEHFVAVIQEKARLRAVIRACADVSSAAYNESESAGLLDTLNERAMRIATRASGDLSPVSATLDECLTEFERRKVRYESGDEDSPITGVRTGITKLDRETGGPQPGNVVAVAAGPGGGKTAYAMQMALDLCLLRGGTAIVFNLEMTRRELAERCFVHQAEVNSALLRAGQITQAQFNQLHSVSTTLWKAKLYIQDDAFTMRDIIAKARRWRARHPDEQGMIVVDFIQLIRSAPGSRENRARELGIIAQQLKELAKALNVAVVVLSQLSRSGLHSDDRPTMHDLKESGDIENACDLVILLNNSEKTGDGVIPIHVDKFRNGEPITVMAHWIGRFYRFADPPESGYPPPYNETADERSDT